MELRHLRYFLVMAEELHFARAAERLHIEQSPLSRAIKALEDDLGVNLFERNTRGTRITLAGRSLVDHARRVLSLVDQMKASADAARAGIGAQLRLALLESFTQFRLPGLIKFNRKEDPDVEIVLQEMSYSQQIKGLRDGLVDLCLSWTAVDADDVIKEKLWADPLSVVIPANHRLAGQAYLSLEEVSKEVLLFAGPDTDPGYNTQVLNLFTSAGMRPVRILEIITSLGMMTPLVAAGYGAGLVLTQQADAVQHPGVVVRPISGDAKITTYLLRAEGEVPSPLLRFIDRTRKMARESDSHLTSAV